MDSNLGQPHWFDMETPRPTLWCVGRNYLDHAQEMQQSPPQEPMIFLKAGACLIQDRQVPLPAFSQEVHHEIELAVRLDSNLNPAFVALALDLTARDAQSKAKQMGQPWTLAKSFTNSCPISPWFTFQCDQWFANLSFSLQVNGLQRQAGQSKMMIFNLQSLLIFLKSRFPVRPGDILLTGTPAGVGPLRSGDSICAQLMDFKWFVDFVASDPSAEAVNK